ncbi:phenylalanyl-tRNA synthetase beta chain [Allocatelliglobosispora scoriae]|uniref:Phenylalanine--tRNA ligase beta subunit n=1 Tax=Allocatelliglobosispora scoriae TaxID=643052 RepID=A0A841BYF7_9ACTN|nr:phenylalanyl-tRNA synthetase beta chain [Allocatelliglobosispora scoriae]
MRVGLSWLREFAALPDGVTAAELDLALTNLGIEVESIVDQRTTVQGELVVGKVLTIEELTEFKKPIRFCTVDVGAANGTGEPQEIVCGASNFAVGDLVVVILPGGVLPGGFAIGARKTYGRNSHGMICSARELALSDEHEGIIVLDPAVVTAVPGDDARPVVGLDETIIEVEITPDRGYQMSVRGLARELAQSFGVAFTDPALTMSAAGTIAPAWDVTIVDQAGCDRFSARLVRGVDPSAPTPVWLQKRLVTAGVRSIDLAVDITNYIMLELGQPMHAFDADRISGGLVVRRAVAGERLTTLDGVARVLSPEDMVICDDTGPISLAAVMGGEVSEVVPGTTTSVLFEAAHWDATMVGRTARRHKLFSEAAKRWERGVDRELTLVAIERAVALLLRFGGDAAVAGDEVLDHDYPLPGTTITMDAGRPTRLIGVDYSTEQVRSLLTEVGCVVHVEGDELRVIPPSWRPDLLRPADLVEEVVRLAGVDQVPSVLPVAPPGNGLTASQRRKRSVGRALAEQGYVEVISYPFVAGSALASLGLPDNAVRLANPISEEEPLMRTSLLPPLLGALKRNLGRGQRDIALFEQGLVFHAVDAGPPPQLKVHDRPSDSEWALANESVPIQPWHVAAVLAGSPLEPAGWWGPGRAADWSDAVEAARTVLLAAGVAATEITVAPAAEAPFHPGRCAAVAVSGHIVGWAGELHPVVCAEWDLPKRGRCDGAQPRRGAAAGCHPAAGVLQLPARPDRRGPGSALGDGGGRGGGGAAVGCRSAAGVGAPLRHLRGCAARRRREVPRLQADLPCPRPYVEGRGSRRGPRLGGGGGGVPFRRHPARRVTTWVGWPTPSPPTPFSVRSQPRFAAKRGCFALRGHGLLQSVTGASGLEERDDEAGA